MRDRPVNIIATFYHFANRKTTKSRIILHTISFSRKKQTKKNGSEKNKICFSQTPESSVLYKLSHVPGFGTISCAPSPPGAPDTSALPGAAVPGPFEPPGAAPGVGETCWLLPSGAGAAPLFPPGAAPEELLSVPGALPGPLFPSGDTTAEELPSCGPLTDGLDGSVMLSIS